MQKLFILFLFLFFGNYLSSTSFHSLQQNNQLVLNVKIIGIKDGDTVEALYHQLPIVIRLEHIDAPEKKHAFGTVSKQKLSDLCFGKSVTLITKGEKGSYDSRGRMIAEIYLENKKCINKEMVKAGLAWHYKKYSTSSEYEQLENTAKKNKDGLWSDKNPIAPWNFRR